MFRWQKRYSFGWLRTESLGSSALKGWPAFLWRYWGCTCKEMRRSRTGQNWPRHSDSFLVCFISWLTLYVVKHKKTNRHVWITFFWQVRRWASPGPGILPFPPGPSTAAVARSGLLFLISYTLRALYTVFNTPTISYLQGPKLMLTKLKQ